MRIDIEKCERELDAFIHFYKLKTRLTREDIEDFKQEVYLQALELNLTEFDFDFIDKIFRKFLKRLKAKRKREVSLESILEKKGDIFEGK